MLPLILNSQHVVQFAVTLYLERRSRCVVTHAAVQLAQHSSTNCPTVRVAASESKDRHLCPCLMPFNVMSIDIIQALMHYLQQAATLPPSCFIEP